MTTSVLGPDDVSTYRAIRLEALRSDPLAFCSTHERESALDDAEFQQRLVSYLGRAGAVIVDGGDPPDGMVGIGETASGDTAMLWGMWVRSTARRAGVGRRLVEAAVAWAGDQGLAGVALWVVVGNGAAISLYERCGFVATGAMDVVPGRPGVAEVEMRHKLR